MKHSILPTIYYNYFSKSCLRWKQILIISLLIRLILYLFSILVNHPSTFFNAMDLWVRWDGPHYIDIARNWYQTIEGSNVLIVFYPLYPVIIRLLSFFTHDFPVTAILSSIFFSFTSSILLYELVLIDFNKKVALLSVWFMNIFPTAYFLQAPYTESLFLTTSLTTIYLYRKKSFLSSGIFGVFASATRVNGVLLLPIMLLENKSLGRNLLSILLTPLGFLSYLLINYFTFGDPLYFSKILSSHWYKHFDWPWVSINNLINFYPNQTGEYYYLFLAELVTIFLLFFITILVFLKVRKSYGVYMLANLLLFTSTSFIMSTPRYALTLFPMYILLGLVKNKILLAFISFIFLLLLFCFTYLYTQGRWAF